MSSYLKANTCIPSCPISQFGATLNLCVPPVAARTLPCFPLSQNSSLCLHHFGKFKRDAWFSLVFISLLKCLGDRPAQHKTGVLALSGGCSLLTHHFIGFLLDAEVHTALSEAQLLHAYVLPFPAIPSYPQPSMTSKQMTSGYFSQNLITFPSPQEGTKPVTISTLMSNRSHTCPPSQHFFSPRMPFKS